MKKEVKLKFTRDEIYQLPIEFQDFQEVKKRMERLMRIAQKVHTDKEMSNIISTAIDDIFSKKYGHEPLVTPKMVDELCERLANDMVDFLYATKKLN